MWGLQRKTVLSKTSGEQELLKGGDTGPSEHKLLKWDGESWKWVTLRKDKALPHHLPPWFSTEKIKSVLLRCINVSFLPVTLIPSSSPWAWYLSFQLGFATEGHTATSPELWGNCGCTQSLGCSWLTTPRAVWAHLGTATCWSTFEPVWDDTLRNYIVIPQNTHKMLGWCNI